MIARVKPNPLRIDPTRLASTRRSFYADIRRRYARLQAAIEQFLSGGQESLTVEQVQAFERWLAWQINTIFYADSWWLKYIAEAYERGAGRAYDDVRKAGLGLAGHAAGKAEFLRLLLAKKTVGPTVNAAAKRDVAGRFISERARLLAVRLENELKGCTTLAAQNMARAIIDGIEKGYKPRAIAIAMRKTTDIAMRRALIVAKTELTRAHAEGTLDAMEELGIETVGIEAEWVTTSGNPCPKCSSLEGERYTIDEARGMIPLHPNCVVGESIIVADDVLTLMKTHYTGEIFEILTSKRRKLSVTPNHILLTQFGFIQARFAYEGLQVVDAASFDTDPLAAPNNDTDKACIADAFTALAESPLMFSSRVPIAPEDLHGDGRSCDSEINIVRTNSELGNERKALCCAVESQFPSLQFANIEVGLPTLSATAETFKRVAFASDSSMGRFRDALALLLGHLLHVKDGGFADTTRLNAVIKQAIVDQSAGAVEAFSNCLNAHPILKQFADFVGGENDAASVTSDLMAGSLKLIDERRSLQPHLFGDVLQVPSSGMLFDGVVEVKCRHVVNLPVYDVTTASTLYRANGLVTSNCACAWVVVEPEKPITKALGDGSEIQTATKAEVDAAIEAGAQEVFRGIPNARAAARARTGVPFIGDGDYGRGMYYAQDRRTAEVYAAGADGRAKGGVIRAAIKPDAKLITAADLEKKLDEAGIRGTVDYGKEARKLGYDGIIAPQYGYVNVVNPKVLIVQRSAPQR